MARALAEQGASAPGPLARYRTKLFTAQPNHAHQVTCWSVSKVWHLPRVKSSSELRRSKVHLDFPAEVDLFCGRAARARAAQGRAHAQGPPAAGPPLAATGSRSSVSQPMRGSSYVMLTASRRYRGHRIRAIQLGATWHVSVHRHTGTILKIMKERRSRASWRKPSGLLRPGSPSGHPREASAWLCNLRLPGLGQPSAAASRDVTQNFQQGAPPIPSRAGPPRRHTSPELPQRPAATSLQPRCPVRFASSWPRFAGVAVIFQLQQRGPHLPPSGAVQVSVGPCVTMTATGTSSANCLRGTLPHRVFRCATVTNGDTPTLFLRSVSKIWLSPLNIFVGA